MWLCLHGNEASEFLTIVYYTNNNNPEMQIEINPKGYFTSISEFVFLKDLGIGSFGKVRLALHRGTRKNYAIKIIQLDDSLSANDISLIAREIKIHSRLQHPHVVKLWDTLVEGDKIYMVMDYAKNGSLFKYHSGLLQRGQRPSLEQIYRFFYQTLQAVKYLHANDIMHRDLKPQNLLLDEELNIKLCDFGWATGQINLERSTFCGTYEYMAPEMALEKTYDYRIDIWALGVLLYELQHGRAPFQAQNLQVMKERIKQGSYEIGVDCGPELKMLIVDILQFVPEKRLSIGQIESNGWVVGYQGVGEGVGRSRGQNLGVGGTRKHRMQKSMENIGSGGIRDKDREKWFGASESAGKTAAMSKAVPSFLMQKKPSNKQQPAANRKHKRTNTQPATEFQVSEQLLIKLGQKKPHPYIEALKTESETPFALTTDGSKPKTPQNRHSKKIKTSEQLQNIRDDIEYTVSSRHHFMDSMMLSELKKKKAHLQTETGPLIGCGSMGALHGGHFRSQMGEGLGKMKKKTKPADKVVVAQQVRAKKQEQIRDNAGKMKEKYGWQ